MLFPSFKQLIHLARFSEMVSGYRLGSKQAWVVSKPVQLKWDKEGNLHSANSKCIEYRDGWGFFAWHGVFVPERLILHSELLTGEDWLNEEDLEIRRVIQERMPNFVEQVGATCIDTGAVAACMQSI
ncbi:MAG TPA: hypothetical protein VFN35_16335 [Ktedonobacteraceae bacterium]|nr:hypothetical protein [Ktedonobacteraceae bacterium]